MLKPNHPRTVHPYQSTIVGRNEEVFQSATQQRIKYPWTEEVHYQLTDSSSEANYHTPYNYTGTIKSDRPTSPLYHSPYPSGTWRSYKKPDTSLAPESYAFPQCASSFSIPLCGDSEMCSRGQVLRTPAATVQRLTPEPVVIGACGGHCPGFEYVCYYILQVLFVVGILTGISLCIAGFVLRRSNRNGDLGVLVYIGCLASSVCGLLLGVQCCVRQEIRERKQRLTTHIPLHPMHEVPLPTCPLVQPQLPHSQVYRPTVTLRQEDLSEVPWWRRYSRD